MKLTVWRRFGFWLGTRWLRCVNPGWTVCDTKMLNGVVGAIGRHQQFIATSGFFAGSGYHAGRKMRNGAEELAILIALCPVTLEEVE